MSKQLFTKQTKCKCNVRGCRNTKDVFSISYSREGGHTIVMCSECAGKVNAAVQKGLKETKQQVKGDGKPKPLFFSMPEAVEEVEAETETAKKEEYICDLCGRVCASEIGLQSHRRACEKKNNMSDE